MAVSFFQRVRLALRGWTRRREQKEQEFLRRNTQWAPAAVDSPDAALQPARKASAGPTLPPLDREGLQAAYLDGSGQILYYLDLQSGEVVESREPHGAIRDASRFKRIPMRESEQEERRAFIDTLEPSDIRLALMKSVASSSFRSTLAGDRATERAWYNFRNDRATEAVERWLAEIGRG